MVPSTSSVLRAQVDSHRGMETLPVVLMGTHATMQSDLGCSAAELVIGSTLCLPGLFVIPTTIHISLDLSNYVDRLWRKMNELHHSPTRVQQSCTHLHKDLLSCTHDFVCDDTVRASLKPPYRSPIWVITRKYFIPDLNGKSKTVNFDRLKIVFMDRESDPTHLTAVAE